MGLPFKACDAGADGGIFLGDLDADDVMEAAVLCSDLRIAVYDAGGFVEEGWPVAAGGTVRGVLFADVNGDSVSDVVATVAGLGLRAWSFDGRAIENWPKPTDGTPSGPASLGDFDNDGRLELFAPSSAGRLHCWDLSGFSYRHSAALWPLPARTVGNTRLAALTAGVSIPTGGQGLGDASPFRVVHVSASPNPFHHGTQILSRIEGPDLKRSVFRLEIFDAMGRLVRRLAPSPRKPGTYRDAWDGVDARGRPVPSGVYMCLVRAGESSLGCNVVLLK
jgi:hypothetical protein